MLHPELRHEFYRFLIATDAYVANELNLFPPLDEDGLTNKLLQCLNDQAGSPPGLDPNAAAFKARAAEVCDREGYEPPFVLELRHERFTKPVEGSITQSDLLLELSFDEPTDAANSWSAAYLIQAKKPSIVTPARPPDRTRIRYDNDQLDRIQKLRGRVGSAALKFLFYCRQGALMADVTARLMTRLTVGLNKQSDDWASLQAAGLWVARDPHPTVSKVLLEAEVTSFNLARFIIAHYDDENALPVDETAKIFQGQNDEKSEFLQQICAGDRAALGQLWDLLETDPVNLRGRSLQTLRIAVQAPGPAPRPDVSSGP